MASVSFVWKVTCCAAQVITAALPDGSVTHVAADSVNVSIESRALFDVEAYTTIKSAGSHRWRRRMMSIA